MVRRSSVAGLDGGAEPDVYGDGSSGTRGRGNSAAKTPWVGSGGRWTVWPLRVVLWVAIIVIAYRGITAIVLNESPSSTGGTAAPAATSPYSKFPSTAAEAYALEFGQVYLSFSPASAGQRQQELAKFIPSADSGQLDPQLGWNGVGTLSLQSVQVASIDVRSATTAVVTLLAMVNGQLMELGVPIYSSGGSFVVSGLPAWLPAPSRVQPPTAQPSATDQSAQSALSAQLPAFFAAYASGDSTLLNRYVAPGASINGLNGAVRFGSIQSIVVPQGGATRNITVTVSWFLPSQGKQGSPQLTTTYDMSVVDQQSGKWYVEDIRASTQPMGTQ